MKPEQRSALQHHLGDRQDVRLEWEQRITTRGHIFASKNVGVLTFWISCSKAGEALSINGDGSSCLLFSTRASNTLQKEAAIWTQADARHPVSSNIGRNNIYLVGGPAVSCTAYMLIFTTLEGSMLTNIILCYRDRCQDLPTIFWHVSGGTKTWSKTCLSPQLIFLKAHRAPDP